MDECGPAGLKPAVAYFSMEVGLDPEIHTYSGGLGILAGDSLRAAADLGVPMVGVTLLHRQGYFRQQLDDQGNQTESPDEWGPADHLEPLEPRVAVNIEGHPVKVRAWRKNVSGVAGHVVPVHFLDTALPENEPNHQALTDHLYGGDSRYRLCQEAVLGLGGVAMLRALGYEGCQVFHMNEGHSALLVLALLEEEARARGSTVVTDDVRAAVRRRCVFTTHTPVPAGHDRFSPDLVRSVLDGPHVAELDSAGLWHENTLNMTELGLRCSRYINGVSMRHEEISRGMFPDYPINSVTNGVHGATWTAPAFQRLYDRHVPEWRVDSLYLRYAVGIPLDEIQDAHAETKRQLFDMVAQRSGVRLDSGAFTLGFARRAAPYKRADLLFSDLDRLRAIVEHAGPLQVVMAGKAHPRDESGKAVIRRVFEAAGALAGSVRVVYLEDYGMALGKRLCAGVDVWLNTPQKPREASGTSGMKAALNGVPSLSVLDGWWIEGCVEGVTGWAIGEDSGQEADPAVETESLYDKLEYVVLPAFYSRPRQFAQIMRSCIAVNGSFFTAQRMMYQYLHNAYGQPSAIPIGSPGGGRAPAP